MAGTQDVGRVPKDLLLSCRVRTFLLPNNFEKAKIFLFFFLFFSFKFFFISFNTLYKLNHNTCIHLQLSWPKTLKSATLNKTFFSRPDFSNSRFSRDLRFFKPQVQQIPTVFQKKILQRPKVFNLQVLQRIEVFQRVDFSAPKVQGKPSEHNSTAPFQNKEALPLCSKSQALG